jgi:hypothetical protein
MACNTVRMNNKGRGVCSTYKGKPWSSVSSDRHNWNLGDKKLGVLDGTHQLIQNLCKHLLGEYLPLLKTSIACVRDLLKKITLLSQGLVLFGTILKEGKKKKRHAFFKGIPSLSVSIAWIAINTSAGVSTGPE